MFQIPPLRQRSEDIAPLVEMFISEFSTEYGKSVKGVTPRALTLLEQESWPGNIRQLRNAIQVAVALTTTNRLEPKDFPEINPEFVQIPMSVWETLPLETRNTITHELSKTEFLNIKNMNQN